jgi:F-type H+-transporting ATPase subunit b
MRAFIVMLLACAATFAVLGGVCTAQEENGAKQETKAESSTEPAKSEAPATTEAPSAPEASPAPEAPAAKSEAPAAEEASPAEKAEEKAHDDAHPAGEKGEAGHGDAQGDAAHAGGHGHDTTDLSHANAGPELTSPAEWRYELTIATMVVFLLLLALLGKFAWGPIAQGLDKREQHIAGMIADAERNAKESEMRLRELEARLAAQAEEARQTLSAARREGELVKEKMVAEAQAAAQQEKDRALVEIRSAKNQALQEIAQKSVNTAVALATNIIRREVRPEDHSKLINDSLSTFQNNN